MPLNKVKGNMYGFITHTFNMVKGICPHGCSYCYMSKRGKLKPVRFDITEHRTELGKGNHIFVGSSCDMWAEEIPTEWILWTLMHCQKYSGNRYFFQSKNPSRFVDMLMFVDMSRVSSKVTFCTTIETNRIYPEIMGKTLSPGARAAFMAGVATAFPTHVTIEPIMDFDLQELLMLIHRINPTQVNIGADSKGCNLPEPSPEKVKTLIEELKQMVPTVYLKPNLKRLLLQA